MNHIHQHPDGLVYLRTPAGIYKATLNEFEQDYGAPFPALPEGYSERYYKPAEPARGVSGKHNVQNERGVEGQPMPWPEGDAILNSYATIVANRDARLNPPLSLDQAKTKKSAALRVEAGRRIESGVSLDILGSAHYYGTTLVDQHNLHALVTEAQIYADSHEYKVWCRDANGALARRVHTAAQIVELGYQIRLHVSGVQDQYESLLSQVVATNTVEAVNSVSF